MNRIECRSFETSHVHCESQKSLNCIAHKCNLDERVSYRIKCTNLFFIILRINSMNCFMYIELYRTKGAGPRRVKIGPIKWAKLNWSFGKLFSAWKIWYIWWFMEMVIFFNLTPLCSRSLVPNIMKSKKLVKITIFLLWNSTKCLYFNTSTALLH
jgi:surface polysaccharide O-acyltransferase-like enzyme